MLTRTVVETGITLLTLLLLGLTRMIYNIAVGRFFAPAVLGAANVSMSASLLATDFFVAGLAPTLGKFAAEFLGSGRTGLADRVVRNLRTLTLLGSIAFMSAMYVWREAIVSVLNLSEGDYLAGIPLLLFYSVYVLEKSAYYAYGRVRSYMRNEVVSDLAFLAALVVTVLVGRADLVLAPFYVMYGLFAIQAWSDSRAVGSYRTEARLPLPTKTIVAFALIAVLGSAASMGRARLGTIVASSQLDITSAGVYAAVLSLLNPLYLVPRALGLSIFPAMSRLHGEGDQTSILLLMRQATTWLVILMGMACGLIVLLSGPSLWLAYGSEEYLRGASALQLLVISAFLAIVSVPAINALSSTKYMRINALAAIAGLAASWLVWYAPVGAQGLGEIALGFLVGTVVTNAVPVAWAQLRFRFVVRQHVWCVFVIASSLLAATLVQTELDSTDALYYVIPCALFLVTSATLMSRVAVQSAKILRDSS